ncbi:MAG: CpcT/CpeT family chromophore lyase [Pseudomonadota bacterium]
MKPHVGLLALALGACATPENSPPAGLDDLVDKIAGGYSNAAQYAAAPNAWKIEPAIGDAPPWLDQQFAVFEKLEAPAIGNDVIYLQWRKGAADGPISRQRIWSFYHDEDGQPRMDFFSFPRGSEPEDTKALTSLTRQDLVGYGEKCALEVAVSGDGFFAEIPPTCQIKSQSGRDMRLTAEINLSGDTLTYHEAGVRPNGDIVFRVPGSAPRAPYRFERVSAD